MKIILFFVLLSYSLFAQNAPIDSLLSQLPVQQEDNKKVDLLVTIASHYLVHQIDSCLPYAQEGLQLARQLDYKNGMVQSLNAIGNFHERKGLYDQALQFYNEGLDISNQNNYTTGLAMAYNNIAIVHTRKGAYKEALNLYFEALKAEESIGNKKGIAETYNNIGVIYYYQQNIDKTLEYLEKSIAIEEELGHTNILKKGYNNIGALFDYQKKYDQALIYYQKAYKISVAEGDKADMSLNLNNIATTHTNSNRLDSGLYYLQLSIDIKEELGDYRGIAYAYHNFGSISVAQGKTKEAELFYNKSLALSKVKDLKEITGETYKSLATLSKNQQDFEKANEYLLLYIGIKDSLLNEQSTKAIAEMEAKYETAKKEKSLIEQQAEIAEQNLKIKQQNIQLLFISAGSIILLLLLVLVVNYQRQRTKQLEKENQLKDAIAQLELQENLQQQRLRISRDLHDNIGSQLTFIISSLDMLKYGFKLDNEKLINKLASISNFTGKTIVELRDTIWAMNKSVIRLEDFKNRIQNYINQANSNTENIDFAFDVETGLDATLELSSVQGMHIYRIIQETINNSLKYAKATKISIVTTKKDQQLIFVISDNGQGFDTTKVSNGFGLLNMQKRAAEMDADLKILSESETGTKVVLKVNLFA